MDGTRKRILLGLALVGLLLPLALAGQASPAAAQGSSGYEITWWTVDGGGCAPLGSGPYALGTTAGQPDAQVVAAGGYALSGGFWATTLRTRYRFYLPLLSHGG